MIEVEKQTHIVVIDLDESSCRLMQAILQEIPDIEVKTEFRDFVKGFELVKNLKPGIVILNLFPSEEPVFKLAEKITHHLPDVSLFITSKQADSTLVIRAMRAGAREFICQPVAKDELLKAVMTVVKKKRQSEFEKASRGKVMTFFGARGGVGTSTIVTNVASILAKSAKKDIIVVDLNLQFGSTALLLNMKAKYSILDVAKNIDNIDTHMIKSMLPKNDFGVTLLAPPQQIEEAESITANHIEQVLALLKSVYDYIIVDTHRGFDDVTLKALDEANQIFLVSFFDVPAIYNTKRCLDLFQKIGYDQEKVKLLINRFGTTEFQDTSAMEKLINYPIFWRIPEHDFPSVLQSINKGMPIYKMMPNSKLSLSFIDMVKQFNGHIFPEEFEITDNKKMSFLNKLNKTIGNFNGITQTFERGRHLYK